MTNNNKFKRLISAACLSLLCVSFTACGQSSTDNNGTNEASESQVITPTLSDTPKEFSADGISITLNDDFKEDSIDNYTFF